MKIKIPGHYVDGEDEGFDEIMVLPPETAASKAPPEPCI